MKTTFVLLAFVGLTLCACNVRALNADSTHAWDGFANDGSRDAGDGLVDGGKLNRGFVQVSSGYETVCALDQEGEVHCWGKALEGAHPQFRLKRLSVGMFHACGIDAADRLRCWGRNSAGEVMSAFKPTRDVAASNTITFAIVNGVIITGGNKPQGYRLPEEGNFVSLAASNTSGCALRMSGVTHCWGPARYAAEVPNLHFINRITFYGHLVCGVARETKQLTCGQQYPSSDAPTFPLGQTKIWRSFAGHLNYICAIDSEGAIFCKGRGDPENHGDPPISVTRPPKGKGYLQVSTGHFQACAVHQDGHIDCWGENDYGQLNVPTL